MGVSLKISQFLLIPSYILFDSWKTDLWRYKVFHPPIKVLFSLLCSWHSGPRHNWFLMSLCIVLKASLHPTQSLSWKLLYQYPIHLNCFLMTLCGASAAFIGFKWLSKLWMGISPFVLKLKGFWLLKGFCHTIHLDQIFCFNWILQMKKCITLLLGRQEKMSGAPQI